MTIPKPEPANGASIPLPGASLAFMPHWLETDQADALFSELRRAMPWEVHRIRMFGRRVDSPRLSCWMGEPEAVYRYSGADFVPHAWLPALRAIRERLRRELGVPFNSVLANLYRNGHDAMGWHSDDEPELGPRPVIASVSLGATRRFLLKHRKDKALKQAIELPHGSLLVMSGDTQRLYRHALPRTARPVGERINLTFRWIDPARRR
ncbi:alpha-ketoglutarate-dependent dioxygenase AlkB [Pseudoxanthomonas putridarboris]|uniref:Alpha-ketoglutarate-dependent dioxygenase AlkB n=1 Tax=Pseudoxanthomonas putridarboris TaxID=752605 RepID=A0ABU9J4J1_9GAMM